jgi:hypothetical protein
MDRRHPTDTTKKIEIKIEPTAVTQHRNATVNDTRIVVMALLGE